MSDAEIEFLGTKPAVAPTLQRPVTGIVLHVEKNGTTDPYRLSFSRSSSSVIHVGRRPGSESESRTRDIDSGRAMFRCAVVSRKHAKVAFSDSGHVYLIDLASHHGTHLRKAGESTSTLLPAQVPITLSDGDIVTFGKTVGRHDECVEPVVVRVELLRNPLPIKPLVVPTTPSDKSTSGSSRSSSGRYGVYTSSSSDEHSSSPSYDVDSDIEEVQPPSSFQPGFMSLSSCTKAFDVLKSLVPPSHTPKVNTTVPATNPGSSDAALALAPMIASPSEYVADLRYQSPPFEFWSPFISSGPSPPPVLPSLKDAIPFGTEAPESVDEASRASSPMDLESPSTSPKQTNISLPSWTSERSSSEAASGEDDDEEEGVLDYGSDGNQSSSSSEDDDVDENDEDEDDAASVDAPTSSSPTVVPVPSPQPSELQELKSSMEKLQNQVTKLDGYRRKYRTRFNHNVHRVAEKLSHTDDRLAEVNAQHDTLVDKVDSLSRLDLADLRCELEEVNEQMETLAYVDVPDLQSQMDEMERDIAELRATRAADEVEGEMEKDKMSEERRRVVEEAEKEMGELKLLIEQMKELKEKTAQEMRESLGGVKELCDATVAEVKVRHAQTQEALARLSVVVEPTPVDSRKRKRDAGDDDNSDVDLDSAPSYMDTEILSATYSSFGSLSDGSEVSILNAADRVPNLLEYEHEHEHGERPRKRRRGLGRVVSVVAHTAGAVTVGAVAAWTVLAFA